LAKTPEKEFNCCMARCKVHSQEMYSLPSFL